MISGNHHECLDECLRSLFVNPGERCAMKIVVSFKVVPDDQDIVVDAEGALDYSKAHQTVSQYDLNAVEVAAQLASETGSSLVAMTVGGTRIDDSKLKKNILARGVDQLFMATDDAYVQADAHSTAQALSTLLGTVGGYDLVVCGDGSADGFAQQVDVQLAELLGIPCVVGAISIDVEDDFVVVKRMLESKIETVEVSLPAVISVSPDAALPRICGMKDILAAGKKPTTVVSFQEIGSPVDQAIEILEIKAPPQASRKLEIYDASNDGAIDSFVTAVQETLR